MTETRLKKQQRGWYLDTDPGFHAVKEKFEAAEKKNGEKKLASFAGTAIGALGKAYQKAPIRTNAALQGGMGAVLGAGVGAGVGAYNAAPGSRLQGAGSGAAKGALVGGAAGGALGAFGNRQNLVAGGQHLERQGNAINSLSSQLKAVRSQIKTSAFFDVLRKYALLDGEGNPVENLTQFLHDDDFGYGKRKANNGQPQEEQTLFGPMTNSGAGANTGMSIGNALNGGRNTSV